MSASATAPAQAPDELQGVVLFVDDEAQILRALKRMFRKSPYQVLTADGGAAGLEILAQQAVDVIVSDMRMPEMSGAEFLKQAAERWPASRRILLTGYADLDSTVSAVNEAGVNRYLTKPWDEQELYDAVAEAMQKRRGDALQAKTMAVMKHQNSKLREFKGGLEQQLEQRNTELQQTISFLENVYGELKKSYQDIIAVFAHLMDIRDGRSGHAPLVAELAYDTAMELSINADAAEIIRQAALLHDVGTIALSDQLLNSAYLSLTPEDRQRFHEHPIIGQAALMPLSPLEEVGRLIRSHHELFDGSGYPDGLAGEEIPLGARLICVVNEYHELLSGSYDGSPKSLRETEVFIKSNAGKRYDPVIADALLRVVGRMAVSSGSPSHLDLPLSALQPGMVLARDLAYKEGILLLRKGQQLTDAVIEKISLFANDGEPLMVSVEDPEEQVNPVEMQVEEF